MKRTLLIFPLICPILFGCNSAKATYTIKFKMNHNDYTSSLKPANQTIQENGLVREPTTSEYDSAIINSDHDKYTFKYWSQEVDGKAYNFSTKVTSSFTLYAVWNRYPALSVSYNRNNDYYPTDQPWPNDVPVIYGEKAMCPSEDSFSNAFLTEGKDKRYMFKYWSKSKNGEEYDFNEKVTKSFTLYAIWEAHNVHKITFGHDYVFDPKPWPEDQYINDNDYVREPVKNVEFPEHYSSEGENFDFEYWYQEHCETRFDFKNTKVTSSFKIIARYSKYSTST